MEKGRFIAVSGTPGTGKRTFAQILAERLDARLIDLNEVVENSGVYELDRDGTRVVDPEDLRGVLEKDYAEVDGWIVVDGLLSHLSVPRKVSEVVVLRKNPNVLEDRLRRRGYSGIKLRDNLEAEALGIILWEAVEDRGIGKVHEIDTTEEEPSKLVDKFMEALKGEESLEVGKIDWLEDFF